VRGKQQQQFFFACSSFLKICLKDLFKRALKSFRSQQQAENQGILGLNIRKI
jgi:hypothetical protein